MGDKMVGGTIVEPAEEQMTSYTNCSGVVEISDFFAKKDKSIPFVTIHKLGHVTCIHSNQMVSYNTTDFCGGC